MKKKIALLVLFTLLLTTVCLYAQRRPSGRQQQQELENRIERLQVAMNAMRRQGQETTRQYREAQDALRELQSQYSALEDAVRVFCDGDWDKSGSLPPDVVRGMDRICNLVDDLDLDN